MAWARWRSGAPCGEDGHSFQACALTPGCWAETGHPCEACPHWDYQLLPENEAAGRAFLACQHQWRRDAFSGDLLGLDMAGVKAALELAGLTLTPEDYTKLQLIEQEYMKGNAEVREEQRRFREQQRQAGADH